MTDPHQPTRTSEPASFSELPGLGPKSSAMLMAAGITSISELRKLGPVSAFLRVRDAGHRPSLNLLWALEGALTGTSWVSVAKSERTRLLLELDDATSGQVAVGHGRRRSRGG